MSQQGAAGVGLGNGVATSVLAVVVLYKMLPSESATMRTLAAAAATVTDGSLRVLILVFDNTPGGQAVGTLPEGVRYQAAPSNPGLATAYNEAAATAEREGYDWLLTLDQDTELPREFFEVLLRHVVQHAANQEVAAIVPHIFDSGRHVSPLQFAGGALPLVVTEGLTGMAKPYTTAVNSASLLRVAAVRAIGYDPRFPLNNSDTSLFHRLGRAGWRVVVAGDLRVDHQLAIMNRGERMTIERYRQLLADERSFWDLEMGFLARVERGLRLLGRVGNDMLQRENEEFRKVSLAELRLRLLTRRRVRTAAWKAHHHPK